MRALFIEFYRVALCTGIVILLMQFGAVVWMIVQIRKQHRSDNRIRHLTRRLIKASEDQRRHLASELHDDFGQRLSLIAVQLGSLYQRIPEDVARCRSDLNESIHELDVLISDVHTLSHRLHSSKLEHLGLETALRELCQQGAKRHNMQIDLEINGQSTSLRPDVSLCFYRVAQEALNNAVKHSCSQQIIVALNFKPGKINMEIRDCGTGFDASSVASGLGLITMQERLHSISGTFSILSAPGRGTIIRAESSIPASASLKSSTLPIKRRIGSEVIF